MKRPFPQDGKRENGGMGKKEQAARIAPLSWGTPCRVGVMRGLRPADQNGRGYGTCRCRRGRRVSGPTMFRRRVVGKFCIFFIFILSNQTCADMRGSSFPTGQAGHKRTIHFFQLDGFDEMSWPSAPATCRVRPAARMPRFLSGCRGKGCRAAPPYGKRIPYLKDCRSCCRLSRRAFLRFARSRDGSRHRPASCHANEKMECI